MASEGEDWETEYESSGVSIDIAEAMESLTLRLPPAPSNISRPGDELCDTCKQLGLEPRKFVVAPGDKEWGQENVPDELTISLGLVEEVASKRRCPFCRLVLVALGGDAVPTNSDGEPVQIDLSWSTDGPIPDKKAPWNHLPTVRLLRPYVRTVNGGFLPGRMLNLFPEITLLANDSPEPEQTPYFVRPISLDKIDTSLVKSWLSICDIHHRDKCRVHPAIQETLGAHPTDKIRDFRCIDVENNCLKKVTSGSRYATLSYVWGRGRFFTTVESNVQELEQLGALDTAKFGEQIPQTIKDAMDITRQLGISYLWVDSLCIVQDDDTGRKLETIQNMHVVYSAAYLVLVAADSKDAFAGIPGVRPQTRNIRQPIEELAPDFRLAYKTRWQDTLERTAYNTRGWTFQESHMAIRSLYFLGGQVTFRCKENEWQEHLFESASQSLDAEDDPFNVTDIGDFEGMIQTYSDRVFSFNTDIYNAFAGVARELFFRLGTDTCHGIPTGYFDWFLLWDPLNDQTRRLNNDPKNQLAHLPVAPSWSWAGWEGSCFPRIWDWYNRSIVKIEQALKKRTWIIWYHRASHDSTECFLVHESDETRAGVPGKRNFYGGQIRERFALDCSQTEPTERTLSSIKTPVYAHDIISSNPASGFLQFWTVAATFRLDEPTSCSSSDLGPGMQGTRRQVGVFGRSGRELGTVIIQAPWLDVNPLPGEAEFILICEGRNTRAEGGRFDKEEGWVYKVMLIEWHGEYAERVAIGSIGKGDEGDALGDGAEWKEIILG